MDGYNLIDLDQMEGSIIRRRLRRWSEADQDAIMPVVESLQQISFLNRVQIVRLRYETCVYPLYYYWTHHKQIRRKDVDDRVFQELSMDRMTYSALQPHLSRVINTEIDILIEDLDYFAFVEAKEPKPGGKAKFQNQGGVHQLVRQYAQGKILERSISKTFALATIGANNGQTLE